MVKVATLGQAGTETTVSVSTEPGAVTVTKDVVGAATVEFDPAVLMIVVAMIDTEVTVT